MMLLSESTHIKFPQNMRESVVVMRRFFSRRDWRKVVAVALVEVEVERGEVDIEACGVLVFGGGGCW